MTKSTFVSAETEKGVLLAAIIRQGKAIFPTGDDQIKAGDKILVTTLLQNITKIYDLLEE